MSDPILPPDDDDPFLVLGVKRDADESALRRAYAERIRVYRPESRPDDFRRVRQAYEAALLALAVNDALEGVDAAPAAPSRPTNDDRVRRAWTLVADGGKQAVRSALELLDAPRDAREAIHRFLLLDLAGKPRTAALADLRAALANGVPVANWMLNVLDVDELREICLGAEARWELLKLQEDPEAAAGLFRIRCAAAVRNDQVGSIVTELEDRSLKLAAVDHPWIDLGAREALSVLAWSDPERAARILSTLGPAGPLGESSEGHTQAGSECAADCGKFIQGKPAFAALDRFVRLVPALEGADAIPVARDFGRSIAAEPRAHVHLLRALGAGKSKLLTYLISLSLSLPCREALPDELETNAGRVVETVRTALAGIGWYRWGLVGLVLLAFASLTSVLFTGVGVIAIAGVTIFASVIAGRLLARRAWATRLREETAVAIARDPAPPDLVSHYAKQFDRPTQLGGFWKRIQEDPLLWTVWWAARANFADEARAEWEEEAAAE